MGLYVWLEMCILISELENNSTWSPVKSPVSATLIGFRTKIHLIVPTVLSQQILWTIYLMLADSYHSCGIYMGTNGQCILLETLIRVRVVVCGDIEGPRRSKLTAAALITITSRMSPHHTITCTKTIHLHNSQICRHLCN